MAKRRRYSAEFKHEAVGLACSSNLPASQVAHDLGLNPNMLTRWRLELRTIGSKPFVGQGKSRDENKTLRTVLMALWQREVRSPVILHSDRGCQFTSGEYQRLLKGPYLICSMSAVGSCTDNASMEGFWGMLKRERIHRRIYQTRAEARSDVFNYIERFHNARCKRCLEMHHRKQLLLS